MLTYLKNMLQLIISPDNGWEDVDADRRSKRSARGLLWMVAVAAFSVFIQLLYARHMPLIAMFQSAVIVVITYGVTCFIGYSVVSLWVPRLNGGVLDTDRMRQFSAYSVGLLSIQTIVSNMLPITFAILELWPIYVVVIMWRAMAVLDMPGGATGKYLLAVILGFIVPSQLLPRVFNTVIMQ